MKSIFKISIASFILAMAAQAAIATSEAEQNPLGQPQKMQPLKPACPQCILPAQSAQTSMLTCSSNEEDSSSQSVSCAQPTYSASKKSCTPGSGSNCPCPGKRPSDCPEGTKNPDDSCPCPSTKNHN